MEINDSKMRGFYQESFKNWVLILGTKFEGSQVYRSADPTDGKFDYPVQRRRNKQNTAIMRKAEANLDTSGRRSINTTSRRVLANHSMT
jgi:hypothetical protein